MVERRSMTQGQQTTGVSPRDLAPVRLKDMHEHELELKIMGPEHGMTLFLFRFHPGGGGKLSASRTRARVCVCVWPATEPKLSRWSHRIAWQIRQGKINKLPPSHSFRRSITPYYTHVFDFLNYYVLRALRPNGTGIGPVWRPTHSIEKATLCGSTPLLSPPPPVALCQPPVARVLHRKPRSVEEVRGGGHRQSHHLFHHISKCRFTQH
ncbi:hypothetical protein LZ32DRAFT_289061 [Colletotrichum eremochloae]|nr:hypothetical protein LZ32DRAFT_289061 [Colletotrichum eremochloae]